MSLLVQDLHTTAYWTGRLETFTADALVTTDGENRWNGPGEPTIYLAGDPGLTLVEAGRHGTGAAPDPPLEGTVWSLRVTLARVLDLRADGTRQTLGLVDDHWFLDRSWCDGLLRDLRTEDRCAAVMTPSAGAPDATDRWNLVIFVERLSRPLHEVVSEARRIGAYALTTRT